MGGGPLDPPPGGDELPHQLSLSPSVREPCLQFALTSTTAPTGPRIPYKQWAVRTARTGADGGNLTTRQITATEEPGGGRLPEDRERRRPRGRAGARVGTMAAGEAPRQGS